MLNDVFKNIKSQKQVHGSMELCQIEQENI